MGRRPGFKHSQATKDKIAMRTKQALSGGVAVADRPAQQESGRMVERQVPAHTATPVVAAKDALDSFAMGDPKGIIAAMLWKNRHNEPEMAVQITERDLAGFKACVDYLHVTPDVRIVRPQGTPGHNGIPATATRSAIPPQAPTPPRPFVVVALVDRGTENAIKAVENNQEDWQAAEEAKNFKHARDNALRIAGQLQQDGATGNYSSSTINDAVACLVALAR